MSNILVTGGGGFIGQQVIRELLSRGFKVKVVDMVPCPIKEVDYHHSSILDPYALSQIVRGCEYVIHLAAALGVEHTEKNRLECLYINIQGTVNVLEACIKENVKKILFSSSSEVYGDQQILPISEKNQVSPKSNYAITKLVGEEYLEAYYQMYGLQYNIVRFFNIYGERQQEKFVLPKFVRNVLNNEAPTVYGNGGQVRAFCHVDDGARGLVKALFASAQGEIFNIGNDTEPISMEELARRVITVSGKPLEPKLIPYSDSDRKEERDILKRIPSIEKAKILLNYKPMIKLEQGLQRLIKYYESQS